MDGVPMQDGMPDGPLRRAVQRASERKSAMLGQEWTPEQVTGRVEDPLPMWLSGVEGADVEQVRVLASSMTGGGVAWVAGGEATLPEALMSIVTDAFITGIFYAEELAREAGEQRGR